MATSSKSRARRDHASWLLVLFLSAAIPAVISTSVSASDWLPTTAESVRVTPNGLGAWTITSEQRGEFTLESAQQLPAMPGAAFEITVRIRVGLETRALPELASFDAEGREILGNSSLETANPNVTTDWRTLRRVIPAPPGSASVRVRLRCKGHGKIEVTDLVFRPAEINPYETGALITQPHAKTRTGVVLESNHGIVNPELLSEEDRDGDGRWAVVTVNLDKLTRQETKGEDWRTKFEDNPNAILWSDGVVLKSDSVRADRTPNLEQALHFRTAVHAGPYVVTISDPGRAVAVSLDGKNWNRYEGGREIRLGSQPVSEGVVEFWLDACYADRVTVGPVYFDYVRLLPTERAPSVDRIFDAARRKPPQATHGAAEERQVEITMSAPRFASGGRWPVRCGLPVPAGELLSADHVVVRTIQGEPLATQSRAMAHWPDGSVKWLHLDFQHDFSRSGEARYIVAYGNRIERPAAPESVRLMKTDAGIEVDTGAIRFLAPSAHFGMIENVRLATGETLQRKPIAADLVEASGAIWRAGELPVERLSIEQDGPLHAVIVSETKLAKSGQAASGFYHRARIHAYAGSPLVQIDYFVANTDSRPADNVGGSMSSKVAVRSLTLKLEPEERVKTVSHSLGAGGAMGAVIQKTEDAVVQSTGAAPSETPAHSGGWLSAELDGGHSLTLGVEAFREQFPKALRWKPGQLEISLWAEEGGDFDWIEGVGKTHRIAIHYGRGAATSGELLADGPVLAIAAPQWYVGSGAFGWQTPAATSRLPAVETALARHISDSVVGRVGLGFENYGDHNSSGYVKGAQLWDNNEYDLPAGCLVHFARTGDRAALRLGLASALHYLDVDTIHYSSRRADWARAQHVHSHSDFGHHTAQGPDYSHAGFVKGLIWQSYFTGEPIGIEGARGIADWALDNLGVQVGAMERAMGHPLMTLNDVYEATGDEKYLRGSARLVDQALKWEHPVRSGFLAPITESPAYYSGAPFCGGLLPSGLIQFNQWAALPEVDAMLERVAQWTLSDTWQPPVGLVGKGGSPRRVASPKLIASHGRLMATVYERTKDPLFLVVPRECVVEGFRPDGPNIGTRDTGLVFNHMPWILAGLAAHGWPEPDPEFAVSTNDREVRLRRSGTSTVRLTVKNTGADAIRNLRFSMHSRLDIGVTPPAPIERLDPGQTVELKYDLAGPAKLNLTSDYNVRAYGHWCAIFERAGSVRCAHLPISIAME